MNANPSVLLIDDEPNLLFGLRAIMTRAGFAVTTAIDGREGLKRMQESRPDIVVCDIMMPDMDGYQVKAALANDPQLAGIPFLFLTALASTDDRLAGLRLGADDYLTKPFRTEELIERLHAILRRHQAGRMEGLREAEAQLAALQQQLCRDPLTGLLNRRVLESSIDQDLAAAGRNAHPLSVIMLDIDHFKRVNDTYGHAVGDQVLIALGRLLLSVSRPRDRCFRYGGEEFVIVMPHADSIVSEARVNELRARIASVLRRDCVLHGPITLSAGIAQFPLHATSTRELLICADQALYRAKSAGRDRVVIWCRSLSSRITQIEPSGTVPTLSD